MAPLASELRQLRIVSPFSQETDLKVYAHLFDAERHADEARARLEAEYGSLFTCS